MRNYIPTINISSLLKSDFNTLASKNTIRKIEKACVNVGFFQIVGHGINKEKINNICKIGNKFFNSSNENKNKLAPKKWNKKNKNIYRGYFPNNVNGKEGLDIGDLRINKSYASKIRSQYIEYLNLNKCFNKNAINILNNYFDNVYDLSETLFKSIIKLNRKNPDISSKAFSRLKTLSTLRFNYYPNQSKPVEISKQDGVALGCETHVDSGIFTVLYQDKKGGLQVQNRNNKKWYDVPFNKNAIIVNTGRALEFLTGGKFKATNHRVLWNKSKRLSVPFFFEPSYDFKMNRSFLNSKKSTAKSQIYEKFLNQSLKKFIEYQR
ncbi:2OG-Fe(II) oxygenase family protein [Candidatus Pelagibacter sp.]|nr:isopenicillin N synthase family oxygenase [Candidatus Pelagibacter bacterium]MDB4216759.1 isopenicillin N synthase family oxygenase [Candidatus Pelagibacter sp.]MDC0915101.1 2OG-Fe(II) oxygenase family protein [Candidatus Pelagibacter sp.]MDC0925274.1 2OG-Fe(II) oxygenase family protein [Candidatus Pelagibacter sp.]MDC3288410.1 isopenicillin N synthase family oxygenase [Candidatus Pelagibacter sp.]